MGTSSPSGPNNYAISGDLLIVVDVQNGFLSDGSEHVVNPIAREVERWIDEKKPVVMTRFHNEPGSSWETLIHWSRLREPI